MLSFAGILRRGSISVPIVDAINIADAQERLEKYDCTVPSIDVAIPEPGPETVRLNRKKK
jgi:hypothetical protein